MKKDNEVIVAVSTATRTLYAMEDQMWQKSSRGKSYELWQKSPLWLIKRIPAKSVFFVHTR
jgi:hypothetical protein